MGLKRRQWEGPVGLGLIASFIVTGMPTLLFATVLRLGIGHVLLVAITASGLSVSLSGVCRGNLINRVQSTSACCSSAWSSSCYISGAMAEPRPPNPESVLTSRSWPERSLMVASLLDGDGTTRRTQAAIVFLLLPLAIAPFLWYWAFHLAGGWYVDLDLDTEHRATHLFEMFLLDLFAIAGIAWFVALVLLFLDGHRRRLIGLLLVPVTAMALLGLGVLALTIQSYVRFSGR